MKHKTILLLVLAGLVIGCTQQPQAQSGTGANGAPGSGAANSNPSSTATTGGNEQAAGQPKPTLPDDLKTEAYRWYGLSNEKPVHIEVSVEGGQSLDGNQTARIVSVDKGAASFEIERTGGLADQLGTDTVSLQKDGIYTVKSTKFEGDVRNLELPSDPAPGTTWKNTGQMKMVTGESFTQNESFKVVGPQDVTTKAGQEKGALLVTSSGTVTIGTTKYAMDSKIWYAKDKGLVKSVLTLKDQSKPKQKPQVITIQEVK